MIRNLTHKFISNGEITNSMNVTTDIPKSRRFIKKFQFKVNFSLKSRHEIFRYQQVCVITLVSDRKRQF